jgi:error-prone DNA polymerase
MIYHELHARSAFSFLRAASNPEDLACAAARLSLPSIALSDRDGVYGSPRLHAAAKEQGIRAFVGAFFRFWLPLARDIKTCVAW